MIPEVDVTSPSCKEHLGDSSQCLPYQPNALTNSPYSKAAALPLRNCTYNLEVTCRDIQWPEHMKRKEGVEYDPTCKCHHNHSH